MTQEELAEAVGVSREWYSVLESGASTRTSTALLGRLAEALMVTPEERTRLYRLAAAQVGRVHLHKDSITVLESFSRLRSLSKRLLTTTSIEDVLTIANEQVADWFDGAVQVLTDRRRECGTWQHQAVDHSHERNSVSEVIRELEDEILPTSEAVDALNLYPRLANAGDVGTSELLPLSVQQEVFKLCRRRRLTGFTYIKARVRSRTGLIASLCTVHELGHSYSEPDRAVLGAFAELASLAVS